MPDPEQQELIEYATWLLARVESEDDWKELSRVLQYWLSVDARGAAEWMLRQQPEIVSVGRKRA